MCHLSPYTDLLLSNKENMRRSLFVETVMDPNKTCHYTGKFKLCLNVTAHLVFMCIICIIY